VSQPRVGVQLIIFGERTQTDLSGVLGEVSAAGYAGFEGGVPSTAEEAARIRAAAEDNSLEYLGGHCGEDQLKDVATAKAIADGVKSLGGAFVICSGGSNWKTLDDIRRAAAALDGAGKICRDAGLTLCYHNHYWEFKDIDGAKPIHVLAAEADPELVKLCPDVYWVQVGGENPAEFLARYRNRCPCLHFKDGLGGDQMREFRELGRGCMNIKAALHAALACSPEWIVTEQDTTQGDPGESVRVSRECLRDLGL